MNVVSGSFAQSTSDAVTADRDRKLKVVILSHLFPNEEEPVKGVFVQELARALAPLVDLSVIAPISYFPIFRPRAQVRRHHRDGALEIDHPRYLALPGQLFHYRWRSYAQALKSPARAWPLLRDADVLHVHWTYPDAFAAGRLAEALGVRVVLTVHGHAAMGYFEGTERQPFFGEPLHRADRVIAVSDELGRLIRERHGVASEKIAVLHNGYSPEKFSPGSREEARASLGIPESAKVIVSIARLSKEKALDLLIDAVSQGSPETLLYLLGDGPQRSQLAALIQEKGLGGRVFLQGAIAHEALCPWLRAADLFCLPSLNEGCPVVIHEALACGRPVIASAVGAIPDLISSPAYGLLSPPGDVSRLVENLRAGLTRTWDEAAIACHGAQSTWSRVARQTVAVYREALTADQL